MPVTLIERDLFGVGQHNSISVPWQAGASGADIQADLSDSDLADTSVGGWLYVGVSQDNQQTWTTSSQFFQGGTLRPGSDTELQIPVTSVSQNGLITHVKMWFDLPRQLSIGATATFY